jgi:3-hydroxyisobutyrate/3-hydroxypropionate dehydrogenase
MYTGMNTGIRYGLNPKTLGDIINVSSGSCFNSLHMNPVKGVVRGSSAERDFEGGFPTEMAKGVMDMATQLSKDVGAKSVFGPIVNDVFDKASRNEKCKGKECRSVWRLFAEDEGRDLD